MAITGCVCVCLWDKLQNFFFKFFRFLHFLQLKLRCCKEKKRGLLENCWTTSLSKCYPHLNLLPLITNDEDNIRRVDSDNLDGKRRLPVVDASFDCRPSCMTLDRDIHRMDPDAYTLENKELGMKQHFYQPSACSVFKFSRKFIELNMIKVCQ